MPKGFSVEDLKDHYMEKWQDMTAIPELEAALQRVEIIISETIKQNHMSMDRKGWSSCPEGRRVVAMTRISIQIRDAISELKSVES